MDRETLMIDQPIDVGALATRLRRGWKIIAVTLLLACVLAGLYLRIANYEYEVEMRVTPVQGAGGEGLSSKLGQVGGLAAAVGVSLPESGSGGSFKLYIEALQSRDVAERLVRDRKLMQEMFPTEWDSRTRSWRQPRGAYDGLIRPLKSLLGVPTYAWKAPNAGRVHEYLSKNLKINQNAKSPVTTISLQHKNPDFALHLLSNLNVTADSMLRERALLRTNDYIEYLSEKLRTVNLQEQRLSIAATLGDQERIRMVASSSRPFAADMFASPSASERPVTPRPVAILAAAVAIGALSGIAIVLLRNTQKNRLRGSTSPQQ